MSASKSEQLARSCHPVGFDPLQPLIEVRSGSYTCGLYESMLYCFPGHTWKKIVRMLRDNPYENEEAIWRLKTYLPAAVAEWQTLAAEAENALKDNPRDPDRQEALKTAQRKAKGFALCLKIYKEMM